MADTTYYTSEVNWDTGDFTQFQAGVDVDSDSKYTVDHFKTLVTQLGEYPEAFPYRNAYAGHIDLSKPTTTTTAYAQDTSWATTIGNTVWATLWFMLTGNLTMATSDRFTMFSLQSAGPVDEATLGIINNAGKIQMIAAQAGNTAVGAASRQAEVTRDEWHRAELSLAVAAGTGVIQAFLDGYQVGANITTLTNANVTQSRLGATEITGAALQGHLLYGPLIQTATRLGGFGNRWSNTVTMTRSGFAALGNGQLAGVSLLPGAGTDCTCTVYDMDILPLRMLSDPLAPVLANTTASVPVTYMFPVGTGWFTRGVYVRMTGTAPRCTLTFLHRNVGTGRLKDYAVRRQ
jgi:hypothetical protein